MVVDLAMPDMPDTGLDLLKRLRDDPKLASVRIILLTGHAEEGEAFGVLGDDYVVKPFSLSRLLEHVERVLEDLPEG